MSDIKLLLSDTSFYRKCYLICLFFCNISFVQILSYIAVPILFVWGVVLVFSNERKYHNFYQMRYGIWIAAFIFCTSITSIFYIFDNFLYNVIMVFHVAICFFIFYGMHTEKNVNHDGELYSLCRFIIYATTICGLAGMLCLMGGVSFEVLWIKFVIYENRFTGVYYNPNILGFCSVVALFCCHMMLKEDFIKRSGQDRVSVIWIGACVMTNLISLFLCDSNASLVLCMCYIVFIVGGKFLLAEEKMSTKRIVQKAVAIAVAGAVIVTSLYFVRQFCQTGFSVMMVQSAELQQGTLTEEEVQNIATFTHTNPNLDSGRVRLIKNSAALFLKYPVLGIGKGNLVEYSQRYIENSALNYSMNFSDLHNGFLTLLTSSGILGFALFAVFGLRFAKHTFQILLKNKEKLRDTAFPCQVAFICAYLVYACFERALLYDVSFMVLFFWQIMGTVSCLLPKYKKEETDQYLLTQRRLHKHLF